MQKESSRFSRCRCSASYQGLQEAPGPLLPSSQQLLHLPFSPVRNEEWLSSTAPGVLTVGRGSLKAFTVLRKACNKCSFIPVKGQGPRRLTALPKASQQVLEMPAKQGDSPTPRSLDTRWNALVLEPDNLMGPCVTSRRPTLCSLGPTHTAQKDSHTGSAGQTWKPPTFGNSQAESSLPLPFLLALVGQWQLGRGRQEVVSKNCSPGAS